MRVMVLVHATADSEAGNMPSTELLTAMGAYNEQLVEAGVMKAGEGLHPTSKAVRVSFTGSTLRLEQGPFPLSDGLVSGFWLWEVDSWEVAIDWMKRAPFGPGVTLELRRIFSPEDFGETLMPELRENEEALRARTEA